MPASPRDPHAGEGGATPAAGLAQLQALAAAAGWRLIANDPAAGPGGFLLARWGLAREFGTEDEVKNFLLQAGVRHG